MSENSIVVYDRQLKHVEYIRRMTQICTRYFPDLTPKEIQELVKKKVMEKMKDDPKKVLLNGDVYPIYVVDKYILQNKLIVTGGGSLYIQHDQYDNILAGLVDFLTTERSKYKKMMFASMEAGDKLKEFLFNTYQLTYKTLNNSLYGVLTQPNSIFFNPLSGPSITESGQDIITTAVNIFEKFLGNTIFFRNVEDVLIYCNGIILEDYKPDKIQFRQAPSVDKLLKYFKEKIDSYNDKDLEFLKRYLDTLVDSDRIKVYYKNNIMEFMDNTNVVEEYLDPCLGRLDFVNPNKPPKDMNDVLNDAWSVLGQHIFYNVQDYYRYKNMYENEGHERRRRSVLTIDTDSNFLYLDLLVKKLKELKPDKVKEDTLRGKVSTINFLAFIITKLINETYSKYGQELGISAEKAAMISMKNEFYLERLMLTKNKKNYASTVAMQEGILFEDPKIDLKGLAIKKVNTNRTVRNVFEEILVEDILKPKEVIVSNVVAKYTALEKQIHASLVLGHTEFGIPAKANSAESYQDPYAIESYRGTILWNTLFPEQEIPFPSKVKLFKLNIETFDDLVERITDDNMLIKFGEVFQSGKLLKKDTLTVIAVPEGCKEIPEQLVSFIDVDKILNLNIKAGIPILRSAGISVLKTSSTTEHVSNIIKF